MPTYTPNSKTAYHPYTQNLWVLIFFILALLKKIQLSDVRAQKYILLVDGVVTFRRMPLGRRERTVVSLGRLQVRALSVCAYQT